MKKKAFLTYLLIMTFFVLSRAVNEPVPSIPWIENKGQYPGNELFRLNGFAGPVVLDQSNSLKYFLHTETDSKLFFCEHFSTALKKKAQGIDQSQTQVNYFKGAQEYSEIPSYHALKISDQWPGIDVELRGMNENIEKIFTVAAGADPGRIKIEVQGITDLCLTEEGELQLDIGEESVLFSKPIAWQFIQNKRKDVPVNYWIYLENEIARYGFELGEYDYEKELIIDPILSSTYLGSTASDEATGLAIGSDGTVYVCGNTKSTTFPTTAGAFDQTYNDPLADYDDQDIFISRFSSDLSVLEASTFIGGIDEDKVQDIVIDIFGNIFITGQTKSNNYPTTPNAYSQTFGAGSDYARNIIISKLSSDLSTLLSSTYIPTESSSRSYLITRDYLSQIYIAGTSLGDLPEVGPQFKPSCEDLFILKLDNSLSTILASNSIIGGIPHDMEFGPDNNLYITGTAGEDLFTTNGCYDNTYNGGEYRDDDAFILKLDRTLANNLGCTYLGGDANVDVGKALSFDMAGKIIVGGETNSSDFPVTPDAYDTEWLDGDYRNDVFISIFDFGLTQLLFSTYVGIPEATESITGIHVEDNSDILFCGGARPGFPVFCNSISNEGFGTILVRMDQELTNIKSSTYINGSRGGNAAGFKIDQSDNILICGSTNSTDFPVVNAYDDSYNGENYALDVFVTKVSPNLTHGKPCCTFINYPTEGETDVLPKITADWNAAQDATGYYLSAGTEGDPYSLINQMDIGNVLSYEISDLPCGELVSVTIDAYNENGPALGADCGPVSFYTIDPDFEMYYDTICAGEILYWEGFPLYYEGRFRVIYENQFGCDSTLQMNLTVKPSFSQTDEVELCEGESYAWFGNQYTAAGDYYMVFTDTNGCDSTYHLDLAVFPADTIETEMAICDGESYNWENQELTEAGQYSISYVNQYGCDSTIYLQLLVHPNYIYSDPMSICEGDTLEWQGQTLTSGGNYQATYTTHDGCDSIYNLVLSLLPEYEFHEAYTICEGEEFDWQGESFTASGTYLAPYQSAMGCDSVYYLDLTVAPTYAFEEMRNLCPDEILNWQGMVLSDPGDYEANYESILGCDSSYYLTLTQTVIDTTVSRNGDVFIAMADDLANYQWVTCPDYLLIDGAIDVSFEAPASGSYAVIIEKESCLDTSLCHTLIHSGIDIVQAVTIELFPNPVLNDVFNVRVAGQTESFQYQLLDVRGHIVLQSHTRGTQTRVSTGNLTPGLYLWRCNLEGKSIIKKLIIL